MNVPVTPEGKLTFEDGVSAPGKYVEMRAEIDVLCLISNCPQLNNPCNGYNPTPIEVLIWADVPQGPGGESRRDRVPHSPHVKENGRRLRGRLFGSGQASLHVEQANQAVPIGPAPASQSYLSFESILDAADKTGAQAIHPGYGFSAKMPPSPKPARRVGSSSSARSRSISARSA